MGGDWPMTHDELLAKIDWTWNHYAEDLFVNALKAVVELHKPYTEREDGMIICTVACNDYAGYLEPYPCPTIQAIEKELA